MIEIRLKAKYRQGGRWPSSCKGGGNNQGSSMGKHMPHPQVHGFKRNHYKCEPRWNPREGA